MKTFTTYAEKKAKQFLNLLQGYTKGIRMTAILILLLMGVSEAHAWGWVKYESTSPATIYPGDKVDIQMLLNGDANGATYKRFGYGTTNSKAGLTWSENYNWIENVGNDNRWKFYFIPTSATTYYWSLWIGWGSSVGDNGRYYKTGDWNEGSGSYQSASVTVNAVPKVKAFTATAQSTSSIALSWTKNSLNDDVLIVQGSSTAPTQGTSYSNGSTIGTGKVVYKGNATSTTITGLSASTSYTFYIYSIHNSKYYSASTSASATTKTPTYSYTVTAGEGGKVSPESGTVDQGSGVTITATPNDGYEFDKWTATNGTLANANSASTTFTPSANNANATASFKLAGCTQTPTTPTSLTAKVGGSALAGAVCSGTNVTLTAGGSISVGSLQWGTGTVGENIIAAGNGRSSITVSPVATTTYWVRSIITEAGVCEGVTSDAKTLQVSITPALVQPILSKSTLTLEEGGSTGSITVTSGTTGGTWTSSDTNVATVNNGTVTPVGPGTATITYTVSNGCEEDKTATCTVTVDAKPYYIAGRLQQNWNTSSKTQQFTYVSNGQYKYETGKTVAELSAQWQDNNYTADQYFFIHAGGGLPNSFTSSGNNGHNFHQKLGYENALALSSNTSDDQEKYIKFADVTDNSSDVVIWWEPSTNKLWYTATANLNTNYYLLGFGSSNWTVNDARRFVKDENDPTKAKVTITLAKGEYKKDTGDGFKINDNFTGKWYGNDGTMTRSNCTGWSFTENTPNTGLTADVAGDYVFTLDLTNMQLSVTYPEAYTVTYSRVPEAAADAPTTNPSITSGALVLSGTEVTFTAQNAKTGYTWKGWYDNNEGTGTALSTNKVYTRSIDADTKIYAVYTVNTYNIAIVANPVEAAETLTSSPQSVGVEEVNISTTAKFTYKFDNWTATDGITITDASNPSTSIKATKAGTVTANFTQLQPTTVYLKPNTEWKQSDARFAIHYWHDGQPAGWVDMTDAGCNRDYFVATIPAGYTNFLFARMDPSNTENKWDADIDWNKTGDLTIPTDGKNLFTLPTSGDQVWNGATGTWGTYTPPTYTININAPEAGSIAVTVGGSTTTVTNTPKQITNIAAGSTFTVAYTPSTGFKLGHSEINGTKEEYTGAGTYTVCGPVDITAHFITASDQVVYLRPNDNWLAADALFYAYAFNRYGDNEWIELTTKETDYTGAFGGTIPAGYSDVIFVRLNPNGTDNSNNKLNFNNAWNQTIDYVIPINTTKNAPPMSAMSSGDDYVISINTTNNRFIIGEKVTSGSDKDKYKGSWEASDTPIYGIPGDWQGTWAANEYPLMGPDGKVTVNITQTNDTLGFKVYHYPYGSDQNSEQWLSNNGTMVRGGEAVHEGGWTMETSTNNNCGLGVDIAGDYVFAFNIRNKKLTVTYPEIPAPTTSIVSEQRVFEDEVLAYGWVAGEGTEANPYQLYADEAARITVSPLPEVKGLTAYYTFGNTAEQTSNIFDWTGIYSTATNLTVTAYYKNAMGAKSAEATVNTSYFKTLALPFNLMTQPKDEINIDRIKAGANITVQFRSDAAATVGLFVKINDGVERELPADITNSISKDYTHDVDDNIEPCILHYIARSAQTVNGRTFEAKADVVIYKNVIIKVNDPEGWVKNVYMWRDYSDAVLTPWPGDPVLQNYGTWRVFSVKYPYYDRFIINDGNSGGSKQTLDWELPADDTCYELLDPANNGSSDPADAGKYGLKIANCPENLIVEDIENVTLMEGEQIVIMPKIYVGLGYQLSDIEADITSNDNPISVSAMMSGTNVTILGTAEGESNVTVTYILDNVRIEKTFTVRVTKRTKITIQVKVPKEGTSGAVGWTNHDEVYLRYWHTEGQNIKMNYLTTVGDHDYYEVDVPLDANGETNFHLFYEQIDDNNRWRQTINKTEVREDGCYLVTQDGGNYYRGLEHEGIRCLTDQYQVRIAMGSGKTFTSNIVTAEEDTLSFFAPGMNETGYKAGVVMLYKNDKMIATIEPSTFAESNVYTATVNETGNGLTNIASYTGNYYIRTYGTSHEKVGFNNGKGWNSIKDLTAVEKDSVRFTYFIPRENEFYNHYWVQAMNTGKQFDGKDVSACVANDYNDDLAGKLTKGKGTDEIGDINVGTNKVINVRFGYDPRTNYFGRAIIKGSEYNDFLNIHCDNAYKDKNCSTKLPYGNSVLDNKMQDISNWVYQRDFYVPITNSYPSASLYVEATSPSTEMTVTDHLLGYVINEVTGEESNTPVQRTVIGSGTNNGTYLMRVVYDFKTNRIIAAWLPQGTIEVTDDRTLHADVLFVRKENNEVPQIQLANDGKIRSLESMYFALELERGDTDKNKRHQEQYWFTLPFDCVVGSISGVPGYMKTWGIQRYRGDLRAQKGWFIETPTFWEWLDLDDVMHAGEGYLLVFDKKAAPWEEIEVDKYDAEGHIMQDANGNNLKEKISMMRLYFPSMTVGFDMQQQSDHLTRTYENHPCTITLHDRDKQDSNWKVIGTTSYNNAGINTYSKGTGYEEWKPEQDTVHVDVPDNYEGWSAPMFRYSYRYEWQDGEFNYWYTPEDGQGATYKSFFGYMVQFAGTINWQPIMSETVPEGIAARRRVAEGERTSYTTRLELANANGEKQDQAFVALDEKATTTFDQNKDLNKIINAGKANIYTLSENIPFAGNTLPIAKATVPVGVVITETGEYTFRMPDGTDGISAILVDNQTGAHTNMLLDEYTVILEAGTYENRFSLVLDPQRTSTEVENIGDGYGDGVNGDGTEGIKKYIIDGQLFIRTANGLFDAKGQRM